MDRNVKTTLLEKLYELIGIVETIRHCELCEYPLEPDSDIEICTDCAGQA